MIMQMAKKPADLATKEIRSKMLLTMRKAPDGLSKGHDHELSANHRYYLEQRAPYREDIVNKHFRLTLHEEEGLLERDRYVDRGQKGGRD